MGPTPPRLIADTHRQCCVDPEAYSSGCLGHEHGCCTRVLKVQRGRGTKTGRPLKSLSAYSLAPEPAGAAAAPAAGVWQAGGAAAGVRADRRRRAHHLLQSGGTPVQKPNVSEHVKGSSVAAGVRIACSNQVAPCQNPNETNYVKGSRTRPHVTCSDQVDRWPCAGSPYTGGSALARPTNASLATNTSTSVCQAPAAARWWLTRPRLHHLPMSMRRKF